MDGITKARISKNLGESMASEGRIDFIAKGKAAQIGEIRQYDGKDYQKQADGKWLRHYGKENKNSENPENKSSLFSAAIGTKAVTRFSVWEKTASDSWTSTKGEKKNSESLSQFLKNREFKIKNPDSPKETKKESEKENVSYSVSDRSDLDQGIKRAKSLLEKEYNMNGTYGKRFEKWKDETEAKLKEATDKLAPVFGEKSLKAYCSFDKYQGIKASVASYIGLNTNYFPESLKEEFSEYKEKNPYSKSSYLGPRKTFLLAKMKDALSGKKTPVEEMGSSASTTTGASVLSLLSHLEIGN